MRKASVSPPSRRQSALITVVITLGSLWAWFAFTTLTILFSLLMIATALVTGWWDRDRRLVHVVGTWWGQLVLWTITAGRLTITGRHHIHPHKPYILVANHQSLFDIVVLFCLQRQFKWMAKAGLFQIPFLGWGMAAGRYIRLARGRHGSIRDTYAHAKQWLASGMSVFMFPEGTRSVTGELGAFKNGAFKLAVDTGVPIVPIVVTGTRDLIRRGSWRFEPGRAVRVQIFPSIDPAQYGEAGVERFRDDVRQLILQTLTRPHP